ncbi:TauD/TfdA dioxygenase family protein [Gordonia phthalatica]|nr:TauD/TfdA family dioxygenase [Gordonia phthalatica]
MTIDLARAVALDIHPLGPTIGAEISDIDILFATNAQVAAIRTALTEHKVLVLRNQNLEDDQHLHFALRLGDGEPGEVDVLDSDDRLPVHGWRSDESFLVTPPAASIVRPVILPGLGGDTSWADGEAAYESLSDADRRLADGLIAVHDDGADRGPTRHPVVRVHPESGRRSLFVNPVYTSHIEGVSDDESRALLEVFYAHLTRPEHIVRHRWRLGDVVLWDARSTLRYVNRDYVGRRRMHCVNLCGEVPAGVRGGRRES